MSNALDVLTERQRTVWRMRVAGGSYAKIAQQMNVSRGRVHQIGATATRKLIDEGRWGEIEPAIQQRFWVPPPWRRL